MVIKDPTTDPELASLLSKIPEIKAFGESQGLKATKNYREYVKLGEDSVSYVVTVSDELAFKPKIFSFPIVGSFNYLGWFHRDDAIEFAQGFEKQGYDVDVRGASAYSTLGWFPDPLLSSMIPKEEGRISPDALPELVSVFMHESTHATIYISNQSYFNESLAFFLADVLTERYFAKHDLLKSVTWLRYQEHRKRYEVMQKRMSLAFQDLKKIYDSGDSPEKKREDKNVYLRNLEKELGWKRKITNATLIQFQTYDPSDHGFKKLFQKSHEDVRVFIQTLSQLKEKDFEHPQAEGFEGLLGKF